jgi:tripartite-type tricarboxylate transporter receptor subunit TctC
MGVGAAAMFVVPRFAAAQDYPTRPIRLVIPFAPGGPFDLIARPWADKMKALLGATVVIENQGGAGGRLAATTTARAPADGYTLLLGGIGHLGLYRVTTNRPMEDVIRSLTPITIVAVTSSAVAIHPSVRATTLKELAIYARNNPGKLSFGHSGVGTTNHLAGELFKVFADAPDVQQVPYRGQGPAIADALSGQLPMVAAGMSAQLVELHRSGKLRILAVASPERLVGAPDIPSAIEAGAPGLIVQNYVTLMAPAGTPKAIVDRLAEATRSALADQNLQQQLIAGGLEPPRDSSPDAARRWAEREIARLTPLINALGLKE